jgi:hypothetical protein
VLLKSRVFFATASVLALAAATAAKADVTISADATENVSCSGGVCQPTASDAVLNVGDLETLLAAGNVTVTTTASGVQANSIDVTAKLGWSANALTLDAYQSISVTAPVTVRGASGLSILTNGGGSAGELAFSGKGHVTFKKLSAMLTINGASYTLVKTIAGLASAVKNNLSGDYAFASDYDASKDGRYSSSPVQPGIEGVLEGLGNTISNLSIEIPLEKSASSTGLIEASSGIIADFRVTHANIDIEKNARKMEVIASAGILTGYNTGSVLRSNVDGTIDIPGDTTAGGLVGSNAGSISECESEADATVIIGGGWAGGLVGTNAGTITRSYAGGAVTTATKKGALLGGLVGWNDPSGVIDDSYARGNATDGRGKGASGGLVGANDGKISTSYSTGKATSQAYAGGLIGYDRAQAGSLNDTYWDIDTSGITNPAQGAGTPANDPGITGMTTLQFQSGLPAGFDPTVWGENANINNGFPYLLDNPPQ